MKLHDLAAPNPAKQIAKVFESYFGSRIRFDELNQTQTRTLLNKVRGILGEHRQTTARHTSQSNPKYLQLVMMEQALATRLKESVIPPAPGTAQPATAGAAPAPGPTTPPAPGAKPQDPKLAAALKKSQAGQTLNPEEQKLVANAALVQTESRLRRYARRLNESEVQQAQVVLAAQDMVDKMQSMLEDVSELQLKELPALVDSIKNQVGIDQATQFNADASAALSGLMQNLQGAKQQMDAALGVVTGQGPAAASPIDAAMGADAGAEMGAAAGAEMGAEMGDDLEAASEMPPEEPPVGGPGLGRARR